jgi:hypothetical protein
MSASHRARSLASTRISRPSTFGLPSSAGSHQYDLSFTTNGPVFTCADCAPPATASNADLRQFWSPTPTTPATCPSSRFERQCPGALLDGNGTYLGQGPSCRARHAGRRRQH